MNSNGVASAQNVGQTTIIATDPTTKRSGSTALTVTNPNVVPRAHILYNLAGGAVSLWDVDTAGRVTEHIYGPYAGYHATAVATGPDGLSHILWNKSDGTVSLWAVDASGNFTFRTFGPLTDGPGKIWKATALSIGPDNVPHILWNNPDGTVSLWAVTGTGPLGYTHAEYGPYTGWTATALATGADGISHILWNNVNRTVSLWSVDTSGTVTYVEYGPFTGYSAVSLSVGTDGTIHILWDNTNGIVSFWNVTPQGILINHTEYGPFPGGWVAIACSTDPTNLSHILWGRPDQTVSLWDVSSTDGSYNYRVYSPPMTAGYTPAALSSGS